MTPSSEEIAAALGSAIEILAWRGEPRDGQEPLAAEQDRKHVKILRSHLSRLREEAEFREAALSLAEAVDLAKRYTGSLAVENKCHERTDRFLETYRAIRALEEPRDA